MSLCQIVLRSLTGLRVSCCKGQPQSSAKSLSTLQRYQHRVRESFRKTFDDGYRRSSGSGSRKLCRYQYFGRGRVTGVGFGGFSLGILGFFENTKEEVEDTIVLSIKKAILAIQREDLDLAEKHLSHAFHHSRKNGLDDAMSQVLDLQANLALSKGELDRAEALFKSVVQRLVSSEKVTVTDNSIIEISIKLAQIYLQLGRRDDAATGLHYCMNIQRHKILKEEKDDEDTLLLAAWALDGMSNILLGDGTSTTPQDNGLIRQGKALIEEAYKYTEKAVGPESQQAVTIRNNLATACALLGEYDTAFEILRELEVIAREKHEGLYPDIVISIGNIHLQRAEFEEAEQVCTEAKNIAKKFKDLQAFGRAETCIAKSLNLKKSASAAV